MKKIFVLVFMLCFKAAAFGQVVTVSSHSISVTAAPGTLSAYVADTISVTGLTPATSGTLTIYPPVKFFLSLDGVTPDYSDTIYYTGTTLPPTVIYLAYYCVGSGFCEGGGFVTIEGGGIPPATDIICICGNMTNCPCAPELVGTISKDLSITISPNPATDMITVSSSDKITSIAITNPLGRSVYSRQYNTDNVQVDIADYPPGLYFIKINGLETRKFVKQ